MHRQRLRDLIRRKLGNGGPADEGHDQPRSKSGTGAMCDACGDRIQLVHIEHQFCYANGQLLPAALWVCAEWMALRRERGLDRAS
jgi:hypothetical protein